MSSILPRFIIFITLLAVSLAFIPSKGIAAENVHGELPLMKITEVTDLIMSPGCKYVYTLTLCPSGEADQMREIVKGKLLAGESKEEILFYFKEIYGPRVLAQPSKEGFYFVAWWFPFFLIFDIFIIVGVILVIWRRRTASGEDDDTLNKTDTKVSMDIGDIIEEEVKRFSRE
jgi:hypothetical protein